MLDDRSAIEHHKYSQRLTELERRSAAAQQRQQKKKPPKMHVGNKIRGIKIKRYVSNGERVLKLVVLFSAILLFMLYIISPLSKINKRASRKKCKYLSRTVYLGRLSCSSSTH